jgi:autotransporter-associated beta strand protein
MKNTHRVVAGVTLCLLAWGGAAPLGAQPSLLENLGRGVVVVRSSATEAFVSWRVLGTDPPDVSFNLYRSTGGGAAVKLNPSPLTGPTYYVDAAADLLQTNAYFVRPILYGIEEGPSAAFTLPADAPVRQYLRVPLQVPAGGTTPTGENYTYSPNDTSVGDLDGDGEYELVVKWDPSNAKDNSQAGYTGHQYLDAYRLDGTRLWRIDLGRNIRSGAHYTQFQVFDLDGDGKAEVACKTADGTVDGTGAVIGDPAADWRNTDGYILGGPEFLTVFNGQTGAVLATTAYVVPRGIVGDWGDTYGNRVDRFLAGVAYLDGQRPSLITARGYYTRTVLSAWNWRDGALTNLWTFDTGHTGTPNPYAAYRGQGNHNLTIGDVDADGRDEIVYGAMAVDHDGAGLYTTGWAHGDALHMSDMDPDRPGLEVFQPHESPGAYGPNALELRDAQTGGLIFGVQGAGDVGRGLALDVDPRYRGYEMWGSGPTGGMYTAQQSTPNAVLGPRGVQISPAKPSINFGVWWDGDPLRELLDNVTVSKWDWLAGTATPVLAPTGVLSNNGTKATPNLSGDILGDWREEIVWRESTNDAFRVYTTTAPTPHRFYTLMHDRQYREAIAWQNTAYNQPPHPSFFLGDGMAAPPVPNIVTSLSVLLGPPAPVFAAVSDDTGASATDFVTADAHLVLSGTATPGTTVSVVRFGVGGIGAAPVDGSGNWSLDYTAATLPDGVNTFNAAATDGGGITGAPSLPFSVRVDTAAPAPPVLESISLEGSLVFEGTAEPGSAVTVTHVGTGPAGTTSADAAGSWRLVHGGPALPPGAHSFTAAATDLAGNLSADSAPASVNTAVAAPQVVTVSDDTGTSAGDGVTSDNTLLVQGSAGPGDTVTLARAGTGPLGSIVADGTGQWTFDYTGTVLADGTYAFRAAASNGLGTSPSSPLFQVRVDTVAPAVASVNRQNPTAPSSSATQITFRVTFSEVVEGVDAADFTPVFAGGLSGAVSGVSAAGGLFVDVTVGPLSGEGSVRLDVNPSGTGIGDVAGSALAGGFTTGQMFTRALVGNGAWIRDTSGGLWSENANWQDGIVGSGLGNTANFSSLELVDDTLVSFDAPRTVGHLVFADSDVNSPGSWLIDDGGNAANTLTLAVPSGSPSITVASLGAGASATLSTALAGTAGFTKLGLGPLVLKRPNTVSGALNVNGGLVRLDPGSTLNTGTGTVNVAVAGGVEIRVSGGAFSAGGLVTLGGGVPGLLTLDSGTVTLAAARTNSDFGSTYRVNGGTFTATDVNIRRNSAGTPDFNSGFIVAGGVATVGTIGLGTNNSNGAMTVSGGVLTATGTVTVGNQVTAGRGGAMRVLGGTFTSTDTVNGIVLARTNGANANNVASATFTGGVSTAEKLTLGFDATVTAGSATVTMNGGTLYLGGGGIVKNGAAGLTTNLNFSSGVLGAKAPWSTALNINLPAAGNVTLKTADAAEAAQDITLSGVLSGPGGFTKAGAGTLVLTGANTFAGPVTVTDGTLAVNGSLGAGAAAAVGGGVLSGTGTLSRAVSLNDGGTVAPGGAAPGSVLSADSMTWNGGGRLALDLTSGRRLALAGALTRGTLGAYEAALSAGGPLTMGTAYTLATFGSTDFEASRFSAAGPAGYLGVFLVAPTELQFLVTGAGATAEYTTWAYLNALPAGQEGAADDPDGDSVTNVLEFVYGTNPLQGSPEALTATAVDVADVRYPAVVYTRRAALGGVTTEVLVSTSLDFGSLLDAVEVSVTPRGDGLNDVLVRSSVPLAAQPRQFFRVEATFPAN